MKIFSLSPVFLAGAAALIMAACAGNINETNEMADFQGIWVDVNGNSRIEFTDNKMTFGFDPEFNYAETYKVELKKDGDNLAIVNADAESSVYYGDMPGFGIMSHITYYEDDGVLSAQEMILDGKAHNFRFVRESQLAKELEIKDLSTDAPKFIKSEVIDSFDLNFYYSGQNYGLSNKWNYGYYSWNITKGDSGSYNMEFNIMGDSYIILQYRGEVGEDYVKGLARLLKDSGVTEHNGYRMENNREGSRYSLYAVYDSKEKLSVSAEGNAADECVFDLDALLEYAALQIPEEELKY